MRITRTLCYFENAAEFVTADVGEVPFSGTRDTFTLVCLEGVTYTAHDQRR